MKKTHSKNQIPQKPVTILFILALVLSALSANPDTLSLANNPENGNVTALLPFDSILIAGLNPGGLYRSTDWGKTWHFTGSGTPAREILDIDTLGTILVASAFISMENWALSFSHDTGLTWSENKEKWSFAGVEKFITHKNVFFIKAWQGGLNRSTDTAKTWDWLDKSLPNEGFLAILSFCSKGDTLLTGTMSGIIMSTDLGNTWTDISSDLPKQPYTLASAQVHSIYTLNNTIYAGSVGALYVLENSQGGWKELLKFTNHPIANALYADEHVIMLGTYGNLFCSHDNGTTWDTSAATMRDPKGQPLTWNYLARYGAYIYGCTSNGIFRTADNGRSWERPTTSVKHTFTTPHLPDRDIAVHQTNSTLFLKPSLFTEKSVYISIYTMAGRCIHAARHSTTSVSIPLKQPPGMYILRAKNDDRTFQKTFLISQ